MAWCQPKPYSLVILGIWVMGFIEFRSKKNKKTPQGSLAYFDSSLPVKAMQLGSKDGHLYMSLGYIRKTRECHIGSVSKIIHNNVSLNHSNTKSSSSSGDGVTFKEATNGEWKRRRWAILSRKVNQCKIQWLHHSLLSYAHSPQFLVLKLARISP